jgi:hypothetical protein
MLSLADASQCFPTRDGKSASVESVRRWVKQGCRGVRLQSQFYAGQFWTTHEWVDAFKAEITKRQVGLTSLPVSRPGTSIKRLLKERHGIG